MEGDSAIVIKALQKGGMFQSAFGHLFQETLLYAKTLHNVSFSHTYSKVIVLQMPWQKKQDIARL